MRNGTKEGFVKQVKLDARYKQEFVTLENGNDTKIMVVTILRKGRQASITFWVTA